jgi:hypothetical protein
MNDMPAVRIRIIRKGNGLVQAVPSPVILQADQAFSIANTTPEEATVSFQSDRIKPQQSKIGAGRTAPFTAGAGPAYVEYEVELANGHCAEGGSQPGAIIDP